MNNLNTANRREGRSRPYHIVENDFATTDATKWKLGFIVNMIWNDNCILQFYKLRETNKLQFLLTSRLKSVELNLKWRGDDDDEGNDENDYEYLFLCNRWLAKNEDVGEIVRGLVRNTKSGLKRRKTLSGEIFFSK